MSTNLYYKILNPEDGIRLPTILKWAYQKRGAIPNTLTRDDIEFIHGVMCSHDTTDEEEDLVNDLINLLRQDKIIELNLR